MKVLLATDHRGFEQKELIKKWLLANNYDVVDMGNTVYDKSDDYTDFAHKALVAAEKDPEGTRVLLFDRSGEGMAIYANKFKGIRAALCWNEESARLTRTDNDSNAVAIPSGMLSNDETAKIVKTWLETPFSGEERHIRRINKIKGLESRVFREDALFE